MIRHQTTTVCMHGFFVFCLPWAFRLLYSMIFLMFKLAFFFKPYIEPGNKGGLRFGGLRTVF